MITDRNNRIKDAVDKTGGPSFVARLLHVSSATIHNWIRLGYIPNIEKAMRLAEISKVPLNLLWRKK
jgi:hypothetical protein